MPDDDDFPIIPHLVLSEEEITNQKISFYKEQGGSINDFFEGSQKRKVLASQSVEDAQRRFLINIMLKMGYVRSAKGGYLDILGDEYNVYRVSEVNSKGYLLFTYSIDEEDSEEPEEEYNSHESITIPANTYVASSKNANLEYETLEDVVINPGESISVLAQCVQGGPEGNIGAGKVDSIIDDNEALWDLKVINPQPFVGGEEAEDDESYRERIQNRQKEIERWGTVDWYKSKAENIEGVHDATAINQAAGRHTVGLIVNQKPTSDILVSQVRDWFYQQENLIGGMDVLVKKTNERPINFQITGTIAKGQNSTMVKETITNDLRCLFEGGITSTGVNYNGFDIGEEFYMTQSYAILMALKSILPSWYITTPSTDIIPRSDEVLVLGSVNLL